MCVECSVYLGGEVVLLQLPSLSQVPGPDSVIQASGPQLGPIIRDVNTTGTISVALELPAGKQKSDKPIPDKRMTGELISDTMRC